MRVIVIRNIVKIRMLYIKDDKEEEIFINLNEEKNIDKDKYL